MIIKSVSFFTSNRIKLAAELYIPEKAQFPLPTIVLCQGLSGVKNKVLPKIAEQFCNKNFITLAFDYRGFGESEGDKHRLFPLERIEDIIHATAFVRTIKEVDSNRIGLYGLSYGGAGCLYATALDSNIKCVVSVSGAIDGLNFMRAHRTTDEWIAWKNKIAQDRIKRAQSGESELISINELVPFTKEFWNKYNNLSNKNNSKSIPEAPAFTMESGEAMTTFNVSSIIHQLTPRPVRIIHGELDNVVPIEDVFDVYQRIATTKDFIMIPNSDHIDLDQGPGLNKQIEYALEWFLRWL